jgi:hypothetical protein
MLEHYTTREISRLTGLSAGILDQRIKEIKNADIESRKTEQDYPELWRK